MSASGQYSELALAQSTDHSSSLQHASSAHHDVNNLGSKPAGASSPLLGDRQADDWRARLTLSLEDWVKNHEFGALILLILATVMNNIGVQQMGYYMPIHSEFLLYGTTLFYTILFAFTAVLLKESWVLTKEQWIATFWLGLFTSLNGIFAQISIPYVDPEITTIVTQISAPVTWFVHIYMFSAKFTLFHLGSILVMFGGMIFGPLYSFWYGSGSDSAYTNGFWILITLAASVPTGFETLYQEKAYAVLKAPKFATLTYYNLFSFFWYFLWSFMTLVNPFGTCVDGSPALEDCQFATRPCSLSEQVSHQRESWKCFITRDAVCCGDLSTLWVMVFVLGYYLSFAIGAFVLRVRDANSIANANAVSTPITSMFFWIPVVAGPSFSVFRWWIFLSFIAVAVGMWMYENHGYSQHRLNRTLINGKGPAHSEGLDQGLASRGELEQPLL